MREAKKQQYLQEKRKYEATLRKTKIQSWKQCCNSTTSSNHWNTVYKLATGKIKSGSTLSTLRNPDGSVTTGMAETVLYMIDTFAPENVGESDNEYHKLIRAQTKTPITIEDGEQFTPAEIKDAINEMNKNKAPGEDGITSDVLQRAFNLLSKSTTAMYNGCLRTAFFPRIWKRAKIIPIVKPGKETSDDISKYCQIRLINTAAKVL